MLQEAFCVSFLGEGLQWKTQSLCGWIWNGKPGPIGTPPKRWVYTFVSVKLCTRRISYRYSLDKNKLYSYFCFSNAY